ncbi:MAG: hypothetical protein FVQ83_15760 [Chloroflexi bacterium]|nr:hypothetical protein [Chloroflexota bacterium]
MTDIELNTDPQGIGTLTVNRPDVRNALDWDAMQAFADAVGKLEKLQNLKVLILTGNGKSFISGGDLKVLQHYPNHKDGLRLATIMGDALAKFEKLPFPTIAAINGPARGGGAEIAFACDIRIISEDGDIGFVHSRLGIITAWGGGQRLLRAVGYTTAFELLATGRVVSPAEASVLGLVNRITPNGEAYISALETAKQISANPHQTILAVKRIMRSQFDYPQEDPYLAERNEFPDLWDTDYRRTALDKFINLRKKAKDKIFK